MKKAVLNTLFDCPKKAPKHYRNPSKSHIRVEIIMIESHKGMFYIHLSFSTFFSRRKEKLATF
jgi:hypothetical protein